jgi:hypothetical protein
MRAVSPQVDVPRSLRWRFPHPSEEGARDAVVSRIEAWWRAFAEVAGGLATASLDEQVAFMQRLTAVHALLAWEIGPGSREVAHSLAITAGSHAWLRPLIDVILARAPVLPGWEFHAYRQARPIEMLGPTVRARTGVELTKKWTARAWKGRLATVQVLVSPPLGLFRATNKDREAALVALEAMLGEEVFETFVGNVEVARRAGTSPLDQLPVVVGGLVSELQAALPDHPWRPDQPAPDGTMKGSVMELKPREADDYPAQADLVVASHHHLELWNAQHLGIPFDDRRFSRIGETFCYLKFDGSEVDLEITDRAELEEAMLDVLEPSGHGAILGGGTGLRYSYVELALTDVDAALALLVPVLRAKKVPRRSWFLFWDARWADEWVPIWAEAPPPPRPTR